jgi:4-hydroxy-4-methyl-2-oxoglutarate aldolase
MHIMYRTFVIVAAVVMLCSGGTTKAQVGAADREDMIRITSEWTGERFSDGRPKVPDGILRRMSEVTIEEAWGVIRGKGYRLQFAGDWYTLHPERVMVGRAVTGMFVPQRPDLHEATNTYGKDHGLSQRGMQNSWIIDVLVPGDVVVVDLFGKVVNGTFAGGNLANSIKAKTDIDGFTTGMVIEGGIRDLDQIYVIDDFNSYVRGTDPTAISDVTLAGLNVPIRISGATCLPGDIVLGGREGVIFIPPHLAEAVVESSERVRLRDLFGFERLREGRYTPGEIDSRWTEEIDIDFTSWLESHINDLPVPPDTVRKIIEDRRATDK